MELGSKSRLVKMNKNERNGTFCFNIAFLSLLHACRGNPQNKDVWLLLNFCLKRNCANGNATVQAPRVGFMCTMRNGSGSAALRYSFRELEVSARHCVIHNASFVLQEECSAVLALVGEVALGLCRSGCGGFPRARTGIELAGTDSRSAWHVNTTLKRVTWTFLTRKNKTVRGLWLGDRVIVCNWYLKKSNSGLATCFEQFFSKT